VPKGNTISKKSKMTPIAASASAAKQRKLELPKRTLTKPNTWIRPAPVIERKPVPKARLLFLSSLRQLWSARPVFLGIIGLYGALNLILAQSLQNADNLAAVKQLLDSAVHGLGGKVVSGTSSFVYLLTNTNANATAVSGLYQSILFIIFSLAVIWTLRQTAAGHIVKTRDGFYSGMYPLIPFLLVFLLLSVQLLPLVIGVTIYTYGISGQIAISWWEIAAFVVVAALLTWWSLRMITATLFAFYAVTLPDMTPLKAYRSAREMVTGRRLYLWRKIIFLPIALLLVATIVIVPIIFFSPGLAVWAFFVFGVICLPVVHGYLYNLYRSLL
jgi:hypothetical protein